MAKITEVKETKWGKLAVFLDGKFWKSFSPDFALELNLTEGRELSPPELARLEKESEHHKAYERALDFLSYRARSAREVERRLTRAGFAEDAISHAISRLSAAGYLDDARFAREWISLRATGKRYGRRRLKSELAARGVAGEIIEEQLAEICGEDDEERRAMIAAKEKLEKIKGDDAATIARKLAGYLLRKGYDSAIAYRVSKALADGHPDAEE